MALRFVLAGVVTGALLWVYLAVLLPDPVVTRSDLSESPLDEMAAAFVVAPVAYLYTRRRIARMTVWLDAGRPPTSAEQAAVLGFPVWAARYAALVWASVAAGAVIVNQFFGHE